MIDTQIDPNDLCVIPDPLSLQLLEGTSEMCADSRLVTANVLPLQRKTIRSVLAAAGIRVVANKKRFIIEIHVVPAEELELSDVPEDLRGDFYELTVENNLVTIRTASQVGALWGAQTLAWLYRSGGRETLTPNFRIRDWSSGCEPGVFVDMARGGKYMLSADWEQLMDRLTLFKMKHFAIRAFGRPPSQGAVEGDLFCLPWSDEEDEEELAAPLLRRWFSVGNQEWQEDELYQQIIQDKMWGDLVMCANERGLTLAMVCDPFGRFCQIPRVRPELSSVAADGTPTGTAFCLSNPDVRTFLDELFGKVIQRDYAKGVHPFHLDVAEAPAGTECHCGKCTGKDPEKLCEDHRAWFIEMLKAKGVPEVWVWEGSEAEPCLDAAAPKLHLHDSVLAGANATEPPPPIAYVRVDDNDPLDFAPLSRFAARSWHGGDTEKAKVCEKSVANVVLGGERGEAFLAIAERLNELDARLVEAGGISLFNCRHADRSPIQIPAVKEYVKGADADVFEPIASEGTAIGEDAQALLTDEDRGTSSECLRTLAGLGQVGAALAEFAAGLARDDSPAARQAVERGIRSSQAILPRWLETVFTDEFSGIVAQFDGS